VDGKGGGVEWSEGLVGGRKPVKVCGESVGCVVFVSKGSSRQIKCQ
jgi:hypothetical protein